MSKHPAFDPNRLAELLADQDGKSLPPVDQWNPPFCGDIDMRIARDGQWYYMGSPIGRKAMVRLFSSVLKREGDDYFLVTPAEKVGIQVDVAPFFAVEMFTRDQDGEPQILFRTNVDDVIVLGPDHPLRVEQDGKRGEPVPLIRVRGNLDALIVRSVFYDLVEMATERHIDGKPVLGVTSCGVFYALGSPDDADM